MDVRRFSADLEEMLSRQVLLKRSVGELLVLSFMAVYVLVFSHLSIAKHLAFKTFGFDLGVYNQAFYTALRGELFYETPDLFWNPGGSFFGVHFAPLLYLILPIYALSPRPETLLILQSFILGIGALPVYLCSRREFGSYTLALAFSLIYLLNPGIHAVNLYDFHLEAFLPAFFLFAFYYFSSNKWNRYFLFIGLITLTIDYANLLLIFFGIYLFLPQFLDIVFTKFERKFFHIGEHVEYINVNSHKSSSLMFSIMTIIIGIIVFIVSFRIISIFGPEPLSQLKLFPNLGISLNEIFLGIFNLSNITSALSYDWFNKTLYIILILSLTVFLPILNPSSLIMLVPWFSISLLSNRNLFYQLGWHYSANLIPFLIIGCIYGYKKLKFLSKDNNRIFIIFFISIIIISGAFSPLNPITRGSVQGVSYDNFYINEHSTILNDIIDIIPPDVSVLTQNDIFAHLSSRKSAYLSVVPLLPEYILLDVNLPSLHQIYGNKSTIDLILETMKRDDYGVEVSVEGIILLKRNFTSEPILYKPIMKVFTHNDLIVSEDPSISISNGHLITKKKSDFQLPLFWHGPYTTLPSGTYEAVFSMKIVGDLKPENQVITLDVVSDKGRIELSKRVIYGIDIPADNLWFNVTLPFSLKGLTPGLEFRGREVGSDFEIILEHVFIKQISSSFINIVSSRYDYKNLVVERGIITDGVIIHKGNMGAGTFWFGPYASLAPGDYTITLLLKLNNDISGNVLTVDVSHNQSRTILNQFSFLGNEFIKGVWQKKSFTLRLNQPVKDLEIRGIYIENDVDLSLLFIEISSSRYNGDETQ